MVTDSFFFFTFLFFFHDISFLFFSSFFQKYFLCSVSIFLMMIVNKMS